MALSDPVTLMTLVIILTAFFLLGLLLITGMVWIRWATSIGSWHPPTANNTIYCPDGTIITPTNQTGLYQCGPCLVYVYPQGKIGMSCPT
jgi:hypothetical protein